MSSHHSLLYSLIAAVLTLISAASPPAIGLDLNNELPDIGDSSFAALSKHDEEVLGQSFMRSVRNQLALVNDPLILEYVQTLGYRLAANSDNKYGHFTFFVVDSTQINAFAGPGGFVGINSGLILASRSESEVAAVMAHEIAHVTQRHIARSVEMQQQLTIPSMAALLASLLIASQSGEAGGAALAATLAGSAQAQVNFIRRNEKEADRVGISTLAKSHLDPRAMPGFFEKLQDSSRYSSFNAPEFLRTHPVTQSRIADSRNRAEQYPAKQYRSSLDFFLVRARIKLLSYRRSTDALRFFAGALKKKQYLNRTAAQYGYALALAASGQHQKAQNDMDALLERHPDNIFFMLGSAQIAIDAGHPADALPVLHSGLGLYPGNLPVTQVGAQTLIAVGKPAEARKILRSYLRHNGGNPRIYLLLARAERRLNNQIGYHEALAEHYFADGDTRGAVTQLRLINKRSGLSYYDAARIAARLHALETIALQEDHTDDDGGG